MVFMPDVDVLRDQLLNILLAARDTVSNIPSQPGVHFVLLMWSLHTSALDDSFVISRGVLLRPTSRCLEEGSRGGSRCARSRGCTDGREHARVEIR